MELIDLEELLSENLPSSFEITFDRKGRIVIKTNLIESDNGELVDLDSEESDDVEVEEFEELDEDIDDDE